MDRRPVVGVAGHGYVVQRPFGALPVTGTPTSYVDGLVAVGARPVLLPGAESLLLLDVVDGLVLTGGGDVDPELSGADPSATSGVDRSRDDAEVALARAAADRGVPLLGVCRGLQVLAVAFGGTLATVAEHVRPRDGHDVVTRPGSVTRALVGPRVRTSALHQQAIRDLGGRWRVTAWAADGVVEAIEWADGDWPALGVQWHPELAWNRPAMDSTGPALFGWLCRAAAVRAEDHRARGEQGISRTT